MYQIVISQEGDDECKRDVERMVSRVPCVDEYLPIEDQMYRVTCVIHYTYTVKSRWLQSAEVPMVATVVVEHAPERKKRG